MINISYLADSMTDYLDMPMPYIMGLSRLTYNVVVEERGNDWMPPDTILFDLDNKQFVSTEEKSIGFPCWGATFH